MLLDFIMQAVELGADGLEIDYKDGEERISAMRGPLGVGIGSVASNSQESQQLFAEIGALRKSKHIEVGKVLYRAKVSEFDSFGESAHRITLTRTTTDGQA